MKDHDLVDGYGRYTKFRGELLCSQDTNRPHKPHWTSVDVYRTQGGQYVVDQKVVYRVFHASDHCSKLSGQRVTAATDDDNWPCPACCPETPPTTGFHQTGKRDVTVCATPLDLIAALSTLNPNTGLRMHGTFGQAVLRELSIKDPAVEQAWMYRRVD